MAEMADTQLKTVSQITREIKDVVEGEFARVAVLGEISNLTRAGSGHVYLTLKDESAQLRAVLWRTAAARVKFELADGLEVAAIGRVELYQARGSLQLIVEELIPQGVGALELAFRQLQEKLAAEGLFDPQRKRPLPQFPRRIALVTSPTSAAVRDMLQVITRRWPGANIIVVPVAVQGEGAAAEIATSLRMVGTIPDVEVVITGRGGGSLEDLWAFNEEVVARAIAECPIPVVSAVGHEIDVSIADLVADRRALTPSEAGELVVPVRSEVETALGHVRERLVTALRGQAATARLQLEAIRSRSVFTQPLGLVHDRMHQLDEQERRLRQAILERVAASRASLAVASTALDALSPLKVLERGYSVTRRNDTQEVMHSALGLAVHETIETLFAQGRVVSRIESITPATGQERKTSHEEVQEDGEEENGV